MSTTTLAPFRATTSRRACGPTLFQLINAHHDARAMLDDADAAWIFAERAFRQSFEERPLELPSIGPTFAKLRQDGAEAEIARRSIKGEFGYSYPGPLAAGEADRMRRVEAGIREREVEFDVERLGAELEAAAEVEAVAFDVVLRARCVSLGDAQIKAAWALETWPDGKVDAVDVRVLFSSFFPSHA